jgi:hypothetical protein
VQFPTSLLCLLPLPPKHNSGREGEVCEMPMLLLLLLLLLPLLQ